MSQNAVNVDEVRTPQARAGNTVYGRATEESQISRKEHLQIVRGNSIRVRRKASWTGCSETSKDGGLSQRSAGHLRSPEASRLQLLEMGTEKKRSIVSSFVADGGPAGSGGTRLCSWWGSEMNPRGQWLENVTASSGRVFYKILDSDLISWAVEAGERGKGNDDFEDIVQSRDELV